MAAVSSILCPVDFSEGSRAALCYAAALADYFGARLTVITVDDPLLANAAAMEDTGSTVSRPERGRAAPFF